MPENLHGLALSVADEFEHIVQLQEILKICQDELDDALNYRSQVRLQLLLQCYEAQIAYHFDEIRCHLDRLRNGLREALIFSVDYNHPS